MVRDDYALTCTCVSVAFTSRNGAPASDRADAKADEAAERRRISSAAVRSRTMNAGDWSPPVRVVLAALTIADDVKAGDRLTTHTDTIKLLNQYQNC